MAANLGGLDAGSLGGERCMIDLSEIVEPEWLDWYRKTPQERLLATAEAWTNYLELGGIAGARCR